ncbi:MAG: response regulator [Chloroflexi bacterium]|nr:response regulator [Chloroflexota bacterium]
MVERHEQPEAPGDPFRVLLVDNDRDITELVSAMLTDEGYEVGTLDKTDHDSIAAAVGRLEPDCILLDGDGGHDFGGGWNEAAYLSRRSRAVPTVMFTAHAQAVLEARANASQRARAADFAAILAKPFSLDDLLDAVGEAVGRSDRFERSEEADRARTRTLVDELTRAGATDIRTSDRREWATFMSPDDECIYQLYWWQKLGVYIVGRYDDDARLDRVGQFLERSAAIAAAIVPNQERVSA